MTPALTEHPARRRQGRRQCLKVLAMPLVATAVTACAGLDTTQDAQGNGPSEVYAGNYDTVWATTLAEVQTLGLEITSESRVEGKILARARRSAFSYGETVSVTVSPEPALKGVRVAIISKHKSSAVPFAGTNWADKLFASLNGRLKKA